MLFMKMQVFSSQQISFDFKGGIVCNQKIYKGCTEQEPKISSNKPAQTKMNTFSSCFL